MLIASRYFATVRRATGTPVAFSVSARRASESGLRGFSASISCRIIAWMAVLEASPPVPVSMPGSEERAQRDGSARRARVLAGDRARNRGFVQADFGGDFAQGQRTQSAVAKFEESRLLAGAGSA